MRQLALPLCLLLACSEAAQPAPEPAAAEKVVAPAASAPTPTSPADGKAAQAPQEQAGAGGLLFDHTPPLVRRAPKSPMRAAEYGVEGDPKAELTVFYFGSGMGGDIEANVTRWLEQFTQPDGTDTKKKAVRSERKVGAVGVSIVEVTGTFVGGMAGPGTPAPESQEDAMLLGAIATGPGGPVFFKLVGPRKAVEGARGSFDAMISSLRDAAPN